MSIAQVYCGAGIVHLQPVQVAASAPDWDLPDLGTDMNVGATALLQVWCSAVQCMYSAVAVRAVQLQCCAVQGAAHYIIVQWCSAQSKYPPGIVQTSNIAESLSHCTALHCNALLPCTVALHCCVAQ